MSSSAQPSARSSAPWERLRAHRLALIGSALLLIFGLAGALSLQPLTRYATRRVLDTLPGWTATFDDARLGVWPPRYTLSGLDLVPEVRHFPLVHVERVEAGLVWSALWHGRLDGWANLERPRVIFFPFHIVVPDVAALLHRLMPVTIDRVQVKDGIFLVVWRKERSGDPQHPAGDSPQLPLQHLEATLEGVATRANLESHATTAALRAEVAHSGTLTAFATADLLAKGLPSFTGQAELRQLDLTELRELLKPSGVQVSGRFDLNVRFGVDHGAISGAVQPILKEGHVQAADGDFGNKLKAALGDKAIELISDRVPERQAVSAIVPFHGRLNAMPDVDLWATLWGVLRNAFVEGLSESVQQLPAPSPSPAAGAAAGAGK